MRFIGHCHDCSCDDHEVETRYKHAARTLCDDCARVRSDNSNRSASPTSGVDVPSPLTPHSSGIRSDEVDALLRRLEEGAEVADPVEVLPLAPEASRAQHHVIDLYRKVRGVRLFAGIDKPADGTPLGCDWAAARLGLPSITVWRALDGLCEAGVLAPAGTVPGKRGPVQCFLPAPVELALKDEPVTIERAGVPGRDEPEPDQELVHDALMDAAEHAGSGRRSGLAAAERVAGGGDGLSGHSDLEPSSVEQPSSRRARSERTS